VQAGCQFFKQLVDLIAEGKNFIVESTLSGLGFQRMIHRLNKAGYTITILFVYLETAEVCIKRVKEHVGWIRGAISTLQLIRVVAK
jgi:predicted ABC-type ATPase